MQESIYNMHRVLLTLDVHVSRVIVVGLSLSHSVSHSVIMSTQDFSQTTNADVTKLDLKDLDHGLYTLMACFCPLWC